MWCKGRFLILLPLLGGCFPFSSRDVAAPVVDAVYPQACAHCHIVKPGQTLYEIAWAYGYDYRELALANHIQPPYVIYPGQKLALKKGASLPPAKKQPVVQKTKEPIKKLVKQTLSEPSMPSFKNNWSWPAKGKVVKSYSLAHNLNKGIDISGALGEEVKAAAAGKVVYSGAGLRGYGQLIIIKHNDIFLSAYAHNHQLLVKEGDPITQGQVIAKMGRTDTDSIKLHFEIRKNGQPIDPLTVLPKRAV